MPEKCLDGTIKTCQEYFDCAEPAGGYNKSSGIYKITVKGQITPVYCLMNETIDQGGWTQVMNLNTQDGLVEHYQQDGFWESASAAGKAKTEVHDSWRADYKNPPVFANFRADKLLIVLHQSGQIMAWRSWDLTSHATLRSYLVGGMPKSGSHCAGALGASNFEANRQMTKAIRHTSALKGKINAGDPIIHKRDNLYTNTRTDGSKCDVARIAAKSSATEQVTAGSMFGLGVYAKADLNGRPHADAYIRGTHNWKQGAVGYDCNVDHSAVSNECAGGYGQGVSGYLMQYAIFVK